jgi:hypothetical protein
MPPSIATDKVCFIAVMAREIHAKVPPVEEDPASDAADDGFREVLEDFADDPTYQELREYIAALDVDEKAEILALMWIGRGDFDGSEWDDALAEAQQTANAREPAYIMGTPLVSDYLEEGLAAFDLSCVDFDSKNL